MGVSATTAVLLESWWRASRSQAVDSVLPASASGSPDAAPPHSRPTSSANVSPVRSTNVAPCVWPWSDRTTMRYGRGVHWQCSFEPSDLAVEIAQHGEGVGTLGP